MTSIRAIAPSLLAAATDPIPGAPEARLTLRPETPEGLAEVLRACSEGGLSALVWGGGNHQDMGYPVDPDVVITTERLNRVIDHQVEDMTLVVQAGVTLGEIAALLDPHSQMAIVPETDPTATIGGVIAAGVSGYKRSRFGPTRDHLLEVTLATGDGRLVRGGGRVVKNVQGYDLMRLAAGSFGSMGVIVEVCLKLWPSPTNTASVEVADARIAEDAAYRPWAVLETREGTSVFLAGTEEEIRSQAGRLGGRMEEGLHWPEPPTGSSVWAVRVPPGLTKEAVTRLPSDVEYVAQHGVGVIDVALGDPLPIRAWAESVGGSLVLISGDAGEVDPWGAAPPSLPLQRRLVARFDPDRVINPGRLPGRI